MGNGQSILTDRERVNEGIFMVEAIIHVSNSKW